jgi:hypothetical protein
MVAWGPREVKWEPATTRDVRADLIVPGDIVQNSTMSSWWKIHRVNRSEGVMKMEGYQVMASDKRGRLTLGTVPGNLTATSNEIRTIGIA